MVLWDTYTKHPAMDTQACVDGRWDSLRELPKPNRGPHNAHRAYEKAFLDGSHGVDILQAALAVKYTISGALLCNWLL
jgi:hypothetical protein